MKVNRVEQTQINKNHPMYKTIDEFCFRSKNLYNYANYIIRQEFINNKRWIKYHELDKLLQKEEAYKLLMSQASQCTLQVLDRNWKSFFVAIKDWNKTPSKYLGMPKLPKYKKKDGRFAWFLKNNQIYFEDGYLWFKLKVFNGYKFKTHLTDKDRIISIRFVPKGSIYILEIVYEKKIIERLKESQKICSIDLGVNNFATITNNIGEMPIIINGKGIKSINQYWNKRKAKMQSELKLRNNKDWSRRLDCITLKRNNKIKNFMHHASRTVIEYCKGLDIDTLIIGLNKTWKQESSMGNKTNQKFVYIPFDMFIKQVEYKCRENNINFILTEENYTSGTSFLDDELPIKDNYNKSRRLKRGLFKSDNGTLINSDVNGSCQIMKKVFPNAFVDGIEGCLTPIILNVVKVA